MVKTWSLEEAASYPCHRNKHKQCIKTLFWTPNLDLLRNKWNHFTSLARTMLSNKKQELDLIKSSNIKLTSTFSFSFSIDYALKYEQTKAKRQNNEKCLILSRIYQCTIMKSVKVHYFSTKKQQWQYIP